MNHHTLMRIIRLTFVSGCCCTLLACYTLLDTDSLQGGTNDSGGMNQQTDAIQSLDQATDSDLQADLNLDATSDRQNLDVSTYPSDLPQGDQTVIDKGIEDKGGKDVNNVYDLNQQNDHGLMDHFIPDLDPVDQSIPDQAQVVDQPIIEMDGAIPDIPDIATLDQQLPDVPTNDMFNLDSLNNDCVITD